MKRGLRWLMLLGLSLWLGACSTWPGTQRAPLLKLSPASLGRELAVAQSMEVQVFGQSRVFDTALEVDVQEVRLAVLQMGQTIARLSWNGEQLSQVLAPGWPEVVPAEQVLSDLQYVWWPMAGIQAALPPGWSLVSVPNGRELHHGDRLTLTVSAPVRGVIEIRHVGQDHIVRLRTQGDQPDWVTP